jgi:hypothetical protein
MTNNGWMKNDEGTLKKWKIPAWVIRRTDKSMAEWKMTKGQTMAEWKMTKEVRKDGRYQHG